MLNLPLEVLFLVHFGNHFAKIERRALKIKLEVTQSGFQSGVETAPLAAVSAGYCHFLGQFQAKSRT